MSFNQKIRKLDIFKKVPKDLSEGTNAGGLISIITAVLIVFFTFHEIYDFINPKTVSRISYDAPFTRAEMKYIIIYSVSTSTSSFQASLAKSCLWICKMSWCLIIPTSDRSRSTDSTPMAEDSKIPTSNYWENRTSKNSMIWPKKLSSEN